QPGAVGRTPTNPVTGVGTPAETSGVHTRKGATATLKQSAMSIKAAERETRLIWISEDRSASAMTSKFVLPVAPKINATPYTKNAEENDPRRKYFNADSLDFRSVRRKPAIT